MTSRRDVRIVGVCKLIEAEDFGDDRRVTFGNDPFKHCKPRKSGRNLGGDGKRERMTCAGLVEDSLAVVVGLRRALRGDELFLSTRLLV